MDVYKSDRQLTTVNATSGEGMTQAIFHVTVPHPQIPPYPDVGPRFSSLKEAQEKTRQYRDKLLEDWIPRKLSSNEIKEHRLLTQSHIDEIRRLENIQASIDKVDELLEHKLFWARIKYRVFFSRTFRIDDLPTEIITNIFHLVAWSVQDPVEAIKERTHLVSVSRHWRIVATQDNILWNVIWFLPSRYDIAFLWLERAGNAALEIRINDSERHPLDRALATKMIDALFKKVSNIRVLIVMAREWEPALLFHHQLQEVAKRNISMCLERFEIHRTGLTILEPGPGFTQELLIPVPLFGGAQVPSLHSLAIDGIHIDWEKSALTNLSTLDIRRQPLDKSPSLRCFRRMLSSPNLISMIIISGGPQWPASSFEAFRLEPMKLSKLKSLALGGFSLHYGSYIASTFSAPNLVDLTLTSIFGTDAEYFHYFKRLGSMPSILSLTLHSTGPFSSHHQTSAFFRWLKTVPRLTYLRLINAHQTNIYVFLYDTDGNFNPSETKSLICPNLKYLELAQVPDPNSIVQLVGKRKALGFPFHKIYIEQEASRKLQAEKPTVMLSLQSIVGKNNILTLRMGQRSREFDSLQ